MWAGRMQVNVTSKCSKSQMTQTFSNYSSKLKLSIGG